MAHRVNGTSTNHQVPPVLLVFKVLAELSHGWGSKIQNLALPSGTLEVPSYLNDRVGQMSWTVECSNKIKRTPRSLEGGWFYDNRKLPLRFNPKQVSWAPNHQIAMSSGWWISQRLPPCCKDPPPNVSDQIPEPNSSHCP